MRLSERSGVTAEKLHRRPAAKVQALNLTPPDTIVEVITNPGEMQMSYTLRTGTQHGRSNARKYLGQPFRQRLSRCHFHVAKNTPIRVTLRHGA